ncbi:MAG: ATP synthase F0 subunit B [Verrucomicrobia bacterium]|nr:MAG: ATP synthase F0 subunit B [Verrucomicrobiota bacterium]
MLNSLILLTTNPADVIENANAITKIAGQFGVQWNLLIAQIINFVLVAFLLYHFAFKPILKTLDERQKKIADGLRYTEEIEKKLKDTQAEQHAILHQANLEKKEILEKAHDQAKAYSEKQSQDAVSKAEYIIKKAEEAIALEKQKMLQSTRSELAQLVIATSEKVLQKNLSKEEQSRFNETATQELSLKSS